MSFPTDFHADRVELMLTMAKTKADLECLVRSLDARNVQLQGVRDYLAREVNAPRAVLEPPAVRANS